MFLLLPLLESSLQCHGPYHSTIRWNTDLLDCCCVVFGYSCEAVSRRSSQTTCSVRRCFLATIVVAFLSMTNRSWISTAIVSANQATNFWIDRVYLDHAWMMMMMVLLTMTSIACNHRPADLRVTIRPLPPLAGCSNSSTRCACFSFSRSSAFLVCPFSPCPSWIAWRMLFWHPCRCYHFCWHLAPRRRHCGICPDPYACSSCRPGYDCYVCHRSRPPPYHRTLRMNQSCHAPFPNPPPHRHLPYLAENWISDQHQHYHFDYYDHPNLWKIMDADPID
mmetsp:Transcript_2222/g.5783  ORF Transcript_2222/g.5783 Transcript_2222/m.5783 type:complete len:278 (-) Transcript_2222:1142-1975(-)